MSTTRQIGINVVTLWIAFILRAAIGLLLVPFLIVELGRDIYGITILLGVVVSFTQIADLGLRMALGRQLSEALAHNNFSTFNSLASTAMAIWIVVGILMSAACISCAASIVEFLGVSRSIFDDAVVLLQIFGGVSILLAFVTPVFSAILSSNNRFDIINKLDAAHGLFTGILLLIVLPTTEVGVYGWAAIMLCGSLLVLSTKIFISFRIVPALKLSLRQVTRQSFGRLFQLSGSLFFLQLTNLLSEKADPLILSNVLGPSSLALYSPALTLSQKVQPLVLVLSNQLYPTTTKLHTNSDNKGMVDTLLIGTRLTIAMGIVVFAILGVFSQDICRVWLNPTLGDDYQVAGNVLLGWSAVHLFQAAAGTQWPVLLAKKRLTFLIATQLPLAVLNIAASIVLIRYTDVGIVGVVIPTVVSALTRRVLTTVYVSKLMNMDLRKYLREAYGRPVILAITLFPTAWFISLRSEIETLPQLMVATGAATFIGVIMCVSICLHTKEKMSILRFFRDKQRRKIS